MKKPLVVFLTLMILAAVASFYFTQKNSINPEGKSKTGNSVFSNGIVSPTPADSTMTKKEVDPSNIDPALFVSGINNKYFKLPVGRKLVYEGDTEDGVERIEITIPGQTKEVLGVKTLVYVDKVWVDGELVEDTRDYLAQDVNGNVWYFGEDVDNYEDGELKDHSGSWLAGVNGAQPGIWIKAEHKVGDSYKQEYYRGEAEDMRDVLAVGQTVKIGKGTYMDCVKVYDWTPLDPEAKEHKYYCSEVGALVLETDLTSGDNIELIDTN